MRIEGREGWTLSERLGSGGFGQVFRAQSDNGQHAAAKLVPKAPGAERELLFVQLNDAPNVVPIIDSAETTDAWVLVMPLADRSLDDELKAAGPLPLEDALVVLLDIATALAALEGTVVHRDLKPANVLLLEGRWCLADFGIARYAEASTAPDTRKFAVSPPYAAPERWRGERATAAADVYALGVIAHVVLSGDLPFRGPETHQFREQHLHAEAPPLQNATSRLSALVEECLFKASQARPTPTNLLARLHKAGQTSRLPGASSLAAVNREAVAEAAETAAARSREQTEHERRAVLITAAQAQLKAMCTELLDVLAVEAPSAAVAHMPARGWKATLREANFGLSLPVAAPFGDWGGWQPPAFDVICSATISIVVPTDRYGYEGRSHSLWYCDARAAGEYGWFETAFMHTPLIRREPRGQDPFALKPGEASAKALWNGMAEYQVAWPFTQLETGDLDDFVDRWLGWLAAAARGTLQRPSTMPERPAENTWRR